ncbi:NAD(P)H-dependent oxidoreductase [uncultured Duncaniella sp.]|uniref:flavodoxin family protein n=1 Tax=uncultured Duncaniella sp. TaxID=2768039 RepID=UPI0025AEF691|nr:NAD(P)H-dependent oxidoreductase [uncultured Duncaniella sp.]
MKVIGINGSARRDGNTALIIGKVFEELNKEGIETELIQLADYDIQPCHLEKAREFDPFGQDKNDPCRRYGRGIFL